MVVMVVISVEILHLELVDTQQKLLSSWLGVHLLGWYFQGAILFLWMSQVQREYEEVDRENWPFDQKCFLSLVKASES